MTLPTNVLTLLLAVRSVRLTPTSRPGQPTTDPSRKPHDDFQAKVVAGVREYQQTYGPGRITDETSNDTVFIEALRIVSGWSANRAARSNFRYTAVLITEKIATTICTVFTKCVHSLDYFWTLDDVRPFTNDKYAVIRANVWRDISLVSCGVTSLCKPQDDIYALGLIVRLGLPVPSDPFRVLDVEEVDANWTATCRLHAYGKRRIRSTCPTSFTPDDGRCDEDDDDDNDDDKGDYSRNHDQPSRLNAAEHPTVEKTGGTTEADDDCEGRDHEGSHRWFYVVLPFKPLDPKFNCSTIYYGSQHMCGSVKDPKHVFCSTLPGAIVMCDGNLLGVSLTPCDPSIRGESEFAITLGTISKPQMGYWKFLSLLDEEQYVKSRAVRITSWTLLMAISILTEYITFFEI